MSSSKRKSLLQERRVAEEIDGKVQPGSGAPKFYKGDVRKEGDLRVECKTTASKSYSLKLAELDKIRSEAVVGGEESWALQVEFKPDGAVAGKRFAVIDWYEYVQLREK